MHPGTTLTDAIRQWPTPAVPNGGRAMPKGMSLTGQTVDGEKRQVMLEHVATNWPTPRAEDSEMAGAHRGTPDTLTSATRSWPTPTTSDGATGATGADHRQGAAPLRQAASGWPTPTARDWKGQDPPGRQSESLGALVEHWDGSSHRDPTSAKPGPESSPPPPGSGPRSALQTRRIRRLLAKPKLNPLFVEWLMGWPPGWTLLPDIEPIASAPAATASSTSRRGSRSRRSDGGSSTPGGATE